MTAGAAAAAAAAPNHRAKAASFRMLPPMLVAVVAQNLAVPAARDSERPRRSMRTSAKFLAKYVPP